MGQQPGIASGAVGWDEEVLEDDQDAGSMPFDQLIAEAEAILLDPEAADEALERAKDLAEAVNHFDKETADCEEDEGDEGGNARPAERLPTPLPAWRQANSA